MSGVLHDPHAFQPASVAIATAYPDKDEDGGPFHAIGWSNDAGQRFHMLLTDEQAKIVCMGLVKSLEALADER